MKLVMYVLLLSERKKEEKKGSEHFKAQTYIVRLTKKLNLGLEEL